MAATPIANASAKVEVPGAVSASAFSCAPCGWFSKLASGDGTLPSSADPCST